eukprot:TRINITY_DN67728_c7_g4_i1.p1 TRINITY_DN67728_c7_g4~~TRINITY_DN67728_c7_g4_i1.p1  ORF type:complete len:163 (-),score=20.25 TRINITY_DN67728_c7_g4_i1:492-980(-)
MCGIGGRVLQFGEIIEKIELERKKHLPSQTVGVLLGGDMNTIRSDWFVKLCPTYRDGIPLKTGQTEAQWWQDVIFEQKKPQCPSPHVEWQVKKIRATIESWNLVDPFDKNTDCTVLHGGYKSKLDWLLASDGVFNPPRVGKLKLGGYPYSDHKWLAYSLTIE